MSDPKKWLRSDGRYTEVHTPFTIRAKELMDIYNGLKLKNITIDERLDILLNTKWTVKEWECNITREIVELIDREADMLNRGRPENSLEGLRIRLCNLFLQFIETPEFNPEAARFQKIPYEILVSTQAYQNQK
ncbi:iq motif ubiquitin domain protein [Ichthyophthirius multifiliis]|uniref:Iq motif ubiquitin domain protein n=1 Tax=Ichthyophthirius multifiliis TaxID=5932 RepID=G0QPT3_ICHMU|nr:iq motif ubiquitin domain protein [Ichthyophthirius multifiliis]EGR32798.1 iq motif ubiquitin domain protein [Ichthyophthirius multifiliis]|eukprot:XP_004036784.1 iq motif ubiquitin domain protein [Ichthyophthirius multifiliis]